MAKQNKQSVTDVSIENCGSIVAFEPLTPAATEWIKENVSTEPWQWFGPRLCVEPRYVENLIEGMEQAGLQLSVA